MFNPSGWNDCYAHQTWAVKLVKLVSFFEFVLKFLLRDWNYLKCLGDPEWFDPSSPGENNFANLKLCVWTRTVLSLVFTGVHLISKSSTQRPSTMKACLPKSSIAARLFLHPTYPVNMFVVEPVVEVGELGCALLKDKKKENSQV